MWLSVLLYIIVHGTVSVMVLTPPVIIRESVDSLCRDGTDTPITYRYT